MNLVKSALVIISILIVTSNSFAENEKKNIEIELVAASSSEIDELSATAFGISLANWISKKENINSIKPGKYIPTFEALMFAFTSQIQIWRELKEKEDPGSVYMDTLVMVDDAGFLKEYVWTNHGSYIGATVSTELLIKEYTNWATKNILNHSPRIEAELNIE